MSRKVAREILYQLVFEYSFLKEINRDTLEIMLIGAELSEDDKVYINDGYSIVSEGYENFVSEIEKLIIDFKIERIHRADLTAMIVALYEIEACPEIPEAVSVNEAVNLVKKFSTDKSYSYVNGVLASYLKRKRNIEISDGSGGAEIAEADIEAEIAETETAEADIEAEIAETETEEIAEAEIAETDIEAEIEG